MLKKRIIFTLLYDSGTFVLSRNFRLQRVGDLNWLKCNYNFSRISFFIDELVVLDVSRGERDSSKFCAMLKELATNCFVPISAGGGVRSVSMARDLLRSGADKIVINSLLFDDRQLVEGLVQEFGQQCITGSIDLKRNNSGCLRIYVANGERIIDRNPVEVIADFGQNLVGELYVNSIDHDGTGNGYDFPVLDELPKDFSIPVILAGGVGNSTHLAAGIVDPRVDAVATAHLFNFIGDGLQRARTFLLAQGATLASWLPLEEMPSIKIKT